MARVSEMIRQRRKDLGLTLLQLAELTGVKEATVQRWESGSIKTIKYETIELLANALNCTPSYLMGWGESEDPALLEENEVMSEITRRLASLSPEKLQAAAQYIRFLSETEGK